MLKVPITGSSRLLPFCNRLLPIIDDRASRRRLQWGAIYGDMPHTTLIGTVYHLAIDLDLKYKADIDERQHTETHIVDILQVYLKHIYQNMISLLYIQILMI